MGIEIVGSSGLVEGFNTFEQVTVSDSAYDVSAISGVARITLMGAGGGGMRYQEGDGSSGGDTIVTDGVTTITALGGRGGGQTQRTPPSNTLISENGGQGSFAHNSGSYRKNQNGGGGSIEVAYLDLNGVSTLDITIGAAGAGALYAAPGASGLVTLEYTA